MKNDTPTFIDPDLFAKLDRSISGVLDFSKLDRFRDLARYDNQEINYLMSFFYDEENRCCIEGKAKVTIKLECKRCLNLFSYEIDTTFRLYPVKNDEVSHLSKQLDVVAMENGLISVAGIVEDELILSLPEIPRHADNDPNCQSLQVACLLEYDVRQQKSPFSVLKGLEQPNGKK